MITLPTNIHLVAMKAHWKVSYIESAGKLILIEHPNKQLVLYGKKYSKRSALHLLIRWVRLKAHYHLIELVEKLNRRVKVNYKKVIFRTQEAQWGSYSSTKTISLNYKLIFLSPVLVRHIVLHELCHARYMGHPRVFWEELAKYDKNWVKNEKAMEDADDEMPSWLI